MLTELTYTRQIQGESNRRWFSDNFFDLIVWFNYDGSIVGFQLCYDKERDQHALTWQKDVGFRHDRIDDGENRIGRPKMTPILISDGIFHSKEITQLFMKECKMIDGGIATFVYEKIVEHLTSNQEG